LANDTPRLVGISIVADDLGREHEAEINKRHPEVATKKNSHVWTPTKKRDVHVLMQRVETGGVVTGMAVTPAHPCRRRFCVAFRREWACW